MYTVSSLVVVIGLEVVTVYLKSILAYPLPPLLPPGGIKLTISERYPDRPPSPPCPVRVLSRPAPPPLLWGR